MNERERELRARTRFMILNAVRISGLALVIIGISIARGVIDAPFALGAGLAVAGLLDFFFVPRMLARSWKAAEREAQ